MMPSQENIMNEYKEVTSAKNKKFAVVVARFNEFITSKLLEGALRAFDENHVNPDDIDVWWVPGALEIPAMVQACSRCERYHGIVAIGCIIKGETDHYRYVCEQAMSGVQKIANLGNIGLGNAILTVREVDHATARSGSGKDNKGWEAACAAIIMANQLSQFPEK